MRARLRQARAALGETAPNARVTAAMRALERIEASLTRPPRVGVFGEFNAGKSSLTNLLMRRKALPTSVETGDRGSTLLRYADQPVLYALGEDGGRHRLTTAAFNKLIVRPALTEIGVPFPRLRDHEIIDTMGVSDPSQGGLTPSQSASSYLHAAIWCTLATQAWKRSEIGLWRSLPRRLFTRGLLVVTHADSVRDKIDRDKITERIRDEAKGMFHDFVLVSLPQALSALGAEGEIADEEMWSLSGAGEFERRFAEVMALARADKRRRAIAAVRKLTTAMLERPIRSRHEIEITRLLSAWSHRFRELPRGTDRDRLATGLQNKTAFVVAARGFVTYHLEPWLHSRVKPAKARDIMALLPLDEKYLGEIIAGYPEAHHPFVLRLIAAQIEAELAEVLGVLAQDKRVRARAALSETVVQTAVDLRDWAASWEAAEASEARSS